MSERLKYIEEISGQILKNLCKKDNWFRYLKTASNLYKYPFDDSIVIYAQRPDATAVASYELWNNIMHRYVNGGAKGIALLDTNTNNSRLKYVFDILDTNGEREPFIWQYDEDYEDRIMRLMEDSYSLEYGQSDDFESMVLNLASTLVDDNMPELLEEIKYVKESSFLEEIDDIALKVWYEETLRDSIAATVLLRCGFDLEMDNADFPHLYNFNTNETMVQLGNAVSDISEDILREIETYAKRFEREKRVERSKQNGDQLQESRRSDVAGSSGEGNDERIIGQIRDDEENVSKGEQEQQVQHDEAEWDAVFALQASGAGSERTDGVANEPSDTSEGQSEPIIPNGESPNIERIEAGNRAADSPGDNKQSITKQYIADEGAGNAPFFMDENAVIEHVLLRGSGFAEGKQRIVDFYSENHTTKEQSDFLKNEYGIGGGTVIFNENRHGFQDHNAKGMDIYPDGYDNPSIHLTWNKIAKHIGTLIDNGKYFELLHENDTPLVKHTQNNQQTLLDYIENDNTPRKRRTQPELNYERLFNIAPHIIDKRYNYLKMKADSFMDLSIERIGDNKISISHYGEQNGDLMADPDMELIIDDDAKTVMPATFRNDYVGVYQEVYQGDKWIPKLSTELTSFLRQWLINIENQGHVVFKAQYTQENMANTIPSFDENGEEIGFDIDTSSQAKKQNELKQYGYRWDGMINLDAEEAIQVYDEHNGNVGIYLLFDDDTEALIEQGERQRLIDHLENGGLVGIEKEQERIVEKEEPILTEQQEKPQSRRLYEGQIIEHNSRKYQVDVADYEENRLRMTDLTMPIPIGRIESLSDFEHELDIAGFFDASEVKQQKTTDKINFHITDDELGTGGAKTKYNYNVTAIKLLKKIESENRLATSEEQEVLAQYVGFGGIAKAFDDTDISWSSEYTELKYLLDEEEYKQARASVLNAFFTSPTVIKAMYKAIENMGFSGGNILEPSMGTGNFMGLLPVSMSDSNMYGIEIDSLTGRIAKQLYQRENIEITGFENTAFDDNFFDVAVGNVPFGSYGVSDRRYDKHKFMIHDYFFAKTLDKVRPGGIIAFVTSKGTLDKKNSSVRKYLAQRAELVGAIRLPNNAFLGNARTQVTADIIFLKKRDSIQDIEPDWVQLGQTWDGLPINQYFADNPHMILGKMTKQIGMYGAEETACIPFEDNDLEQQLSEAIRHIEAQIEEIEYMVDEPDMEDTSIPADPNVKNFSFALVDNELYYRENSRMNMVDTNATAEKRIKGMLELKNRLHKLIDLQLEGYPEHIIKEAQRGMSDKYDDFVKTHGRINTRANSLAFSEDSSYYLLCSLEVLDDDNNFEQKADIFTKQTIRPNREITHVDTSSEALVVSLGKRGKVDIGYMGQLTGKEHDDIISDLKGVIFKDPLADRHNVHEGWQTADEYLSGDVREKLKMARTVAENSSEFEHHVSILENVQPKDLEASEIDVRLGTVWIPADYIEHFIFEVLDTPNYYKYEINVNYSKHSGSFNISSKSMDRGNIKAYSTYGTSRINAYQIIEETLNQKSVRITDKKILPDGKEVYVVNKKETLIATQKQTLISEAFKDWIFKDEGRRNNLTTYYNEHFNNIRPREYDGSHIEFVGMNPELTLREHQKNAVARQLYGGNSLLAHVVGAGKSFAMIAAAMESKRLGLSNKNLFTVPNHLTEQLASEALRLYPAAKVLVATKKDFQTKNRKKFCSKIATGDYDIVIIGHSQFEKIPLSAERQVRMLEKQVDDLAYAIEEQKGNSGMRYNVKQMERTRKGLETKLANLNKQDRKDDVVEFEQLGIDRLFVDESHMFKNLFLFTKMRNVAGVSQTQAQKSMDMFMKCQCLDELTGGRGITFATGTPISNSMTEMYTVQRYLQMHELEKRGLQHFDSWASIFGETQTAYELSPEGNRFRTKTRFNKFYNLPELMSMFKNVADVQTNDMLDLPMPILKTGKVINVSVKPTDIQKKMIEELGDRADKVRNGDVDPTIDNMLTITNDGRMIALDQRLANVFYPDDENSKVNTLMQHVYDIWERETSMKGAQLVFCDISTPKSNGEFSIYVDLKKKWVNKGIPEKEIAYIHDAKNEKQKTILFSKVKSGDIRILIGSTFMMGSGMNVQTRLKAIHNLDVPWRPSDLEQRLGRILRQGNKYEEIEAYRYITEETFDAYSYQLIEQKQRFISQIMTSKTPVRSAADLDEAALSYAEVKALATGNPFIKEKMQLDVDVSRLKIIKTEFKNQKYRLESQISTHLHAKIKAIEERINGLTNDVSTASPYKDKDFSMVLQGVDYTEKKDAGALLLGLCKKVHQLKIRSIGTHKGFELSLQTDSLFKTDTYVEIKGKLTYRVSMGDDAFGNLQRIENTIKGLPDKLIQKQAEFENIGKQLETAKVEITKPFEQEFELRQKLTRLDELNHELAMDEKDDTPDIGDGNTPEEEKEKTNERER